MSIIAKKTGEDFERLENGTYQAICINIFDVGMESYTWQEKEITSHKIIILWEVNERMKTGEYEGKRFTIAKKYTLSLNEKSNLLKDLQSWRGKEFTNEELEGFEVEVLKGVNCFLTVVSRESNGKTFVNVQGVAALPKNTPLITQEIDPTYIPEWIQKILYSNNPTGQAQNLNQPKYQQDPQVDTVDPFQPNDDDIPF